MENFGRGGRGAEQTQSEDKWYCPVCIQSGSKLVPIPDRQERCAQCGFQKKQINNLVPNGAAAAAKKPKRKPGGVQKRERGVVRPKQSKMVAPAKPGSAKGAASRAARTSAGGAGSSARGGPASAVNPDHGDAAMGSDAESLRDGWVLAANAKAGRKIWWCKANPNASLRTNTTMQRFVPQVRNRSKVNKWDSLIKEYEANGKASKEATATAGPTV